MALLNALFTLLAATLVDYGFAVQSSSASVAMVTKLLSSYNKEVRPSADLASSGKTGQPTVVSIDFFINSISEVNEISMDYSLSLFFRQRWNDPRLKFSNPNNSVIMHPDKLSKVWTPDVFFKNEKTGKFNDLMTPNILFRISPNGDVMLSQRVLLKLSCPMDLYKFPLDNQTCELEMESYSYTTADMILKWKNNPVQWDQQKSIILPDFTFVDAKSSDCTAGYTTGTFGCLRVTFLIQRRLGYYMSQLYVPSMLIVILSWVSFWIDVNATPARVSLGLLTVLTMTTQSARFPTPRVSYIKALDIWSSSCLIFVFGGLLEFAVVNVMARKDKIDEKKAQKSVNPTDSHGSSTALEKTAYTSSNNSDNTAVSKSNSFHTLDSAPEAVTTPKKRPRNKAEQVDYISRFLFPTLFIAFNATYWSVYML